MKRPRLRPAQAAVEGDQLLKASPRRAGSKSSDDDVRDVGEPVRAQKVARGVRREGRQRVLALDRGRRRGSALRSRRARRPGSGGADEQPADMGVRAQVGTARGGAVQLLSVRRRGSSIRYTRPRLPEPSTTSSRRSRRSSRASSSASARCLPEREADHGVLLVAAGDLGNHARRERALDETVEPVAVTLLERCPLRLTVVGEDDDLVGPRRVASCAVDPAEVIVELRSASSVSARSRPEWCATSS